MRPGWVPLTRPFPVGLEEELGPVVDDQGIVLVVLLDRHACGLDQGLGQLRERDAGVGVEAPGGLGAGEGLGQARQGGRSGGQRRRAAEVLVHQVDVTALQPWLQGG